MTSPRALIINADDVGLSTGINRGVLEACAFGTVTSMSVLVNTPAFADAAATLQKLRLDVGVGLHFNLTVGSPLERVPSLADRRSGRFLPLRTLVLRALRGGLDGSEVAAECAAQLQRLRQFGRASLTHLDSHQHVHLLPGVWPAATRTATSFGIGAVRVPLEPLASRPWSARALPKKFALWAAFRLGTQHRTSTRRVHFRGISLQDNGARFERRLFALLNALPSGTTELMVHPGYAADHPTDLDRYSRAREAELTVLLSTALRSRLVQGDIALTHFGKWRESEREERARSNE